MPTQPVTNRPSNGPISLWRMLSTIPLHYTMHRIHMHSIIFIISMPIQITALNIEMLPQSTPTPRPTPTHRQSNHHPTLQICMAKWSLHCLRARIWIWIWMKHRCRQWCSSSRSNIHRCRFKCNNSNNNNWRHRQHHSQRSFHHRR